MNEILKYFTELSDLQKEQFSMLKNVYEVWNSRINVISRKDMDDFYIHHVLHSLSIAKFIAFTPGSEILDIGTGGGFPGIPLSILFPSVGFSLLDSIEKKIKVVGEVTKDLRLTNVRIFRKRIEDHNDKYDFIVCRAVSSFPVLVKMSLKNIRPEGTNSKKNGIISLKGGDLTGELKEYRDKVSITDISDYFTEKFFLTKRIVYLPV